MIKIKQIIELNEKAERAMKRIIMKRKQENGRSRISRNLILSESLTYSLPQLKFLSLVRVKIRSDFGHEFLNHGSKILSFFIISSNLLKREP